MGGSIIDRHLLGRVRRSRPSGEGDSWEGRSSIDTSWGESGEAGRAGRVIHGRVDHRSTPPIIGSVDAIDAIKSARSPPSTIGPSDWRFTNDGSRTYTR